MLGGAGGVSASTGPASSPLPEVGTSVGGSPTSSTSEPPARPILEMRPPRGPAQRFDMREGPVVMGRHEACQMVLTSPRLSRLHACVYTHRGRLWVADLNSQNGTRYQDKPLAAGTSVPLRTDGRPIKLVLYDQEVDVISHPG